MEEEDSCCLPPSGSAPWLVYTHGNGRRKKFQTFCTVSSQHWFKSIPLLRGKSILSSNDGWVILRDLTNIKMFTLWNPVSSRVIHLPSLDLLEDHVEISCALVYPLSEDDVSVFVFVYGSVYSYRPRIDNNNNNNNTWLEDTTEFLGDQANVVQAIICNGVAYGSILIDNDDNSISQDLVIIEVENHWLALRSLLYFGLPNTRFHDSRSFYHFLASRGRVYAIGINSRYSAHPKVGIPSVYVWELSLDLTKWDRVKCLQGRAFFVGSNATWCYGSNDDNESRGVKQNCVYFEPFALENFGMKDLWSYNLEDESFTCFRPCHNLPTFSKAPTWIMPQHQRLGKDEGYKYDFVKGLGPLQCRGLQQKNKEPSQNKSPESPGAVSITFDKQNAPLDKFILCKLPGDLICLVTKHMHLFDYTNFRATSKELRSISPIAQCKANNSYPLFMFFESEKPQCTLMDPCRNDSRLIVLPELFGEAIQIDSSKDGWLLLCNNEDFSFQYFNPFTRASGEYIPLCWPLIYTSVGFSSCPTSSDCITVGILCRDEHISIFCHHFKEEIWHECIFWRENEFRCLLSSPIYLEGAFYFWDERGYLGEFLIFDEQCYWGIYDKPQIPSENTLQSSYLVECGAELFSVFIGHMGIWVRVFWFDYLKKTWVRVESLGDHVLFLGPSSSFSVVAKEPEMQNRMYLPIRWGNELVFYDLDTCRYRTHMGSESFENLYGMKMHVRCCWIQTR